MPTDYNAMYDRLKVNIPLHDELLANLQQMFDETVGAQSNRPEAMKYFDEMLHESHRGRVKELLDNFDAGNKNIGTFCIYVPEEIPMAVDAIAIPLCGGVNFSVSFAEQTFPRDICPLVKSTLGLSMSGTCPYKGVKQMTVGETTCDAKKKTWDVLSGKMPFHVMEVPQKKQDNDVALWRDAVTEFKDRVENLTEKKVMADRLADSIAVMNRKREALIRFSELRKNDPPPISGLDGLLVTQTMLNADHVHFTEKLNLLCDELEVRIAAGISPFPKGTKRVIMAGCPSAMGNWKVHALVEQAGAVIVADESCTGERYFRNMVDDSADDIDGMLDALADRYFKIDCSCFSPNDERMTNLAQMGKEYKADGVVQYILQTCHTYNLEAMRVKGSLDKVGIPSIKILTDYSTEDAGQLRTRIEAFLETVE